MNERPIGYLHINAQFTHHDNARIAGTRLGLEALASAVAHALKYREAESDPVFVNDGEGYTVLVESVEDGKEDALEQPYVCYYVNDEITHWRERAFKAEAELHRLRKAPPPSTPKQGEGE